MGSVSGRTPKANSGVHESKLRLQTTVTEGYLATGYHGASVPSHRMALPVLK